MDTRDLAMVSKVRVEVRGGTMEACERVAHMFLDHARMAGYLEGVVPQGGEWSEPYYTQPTMTRKMGEGPEDWTELGLRYYGRLAFTFEPMAQHGGGLPQSGFEVTQLDDYTPHGLIGHPGSDKEPVRSNVTDKVIVLNRINEVVESRDPSDPWMSATLADERIAEFELYVTRDYEQALLPGYTPLRVTVVEWKPARRGEPQPVSTRYSASVCVADEEAPLEIRRLMDSARTYVQGILDERGPTAEQLAEAQANTQQQSRESHPLSELKPNVLTHALMHHAYRTLLVNDDEAMSKAVRLRDELIEARDLPAGIAQRARELSVRWDDGENPQKFSLTTEAVEPRSREAEDEFTGSASLGATPRERGSY